MSMTPRIMCSDTSIKHTGRGYPGIREAYRRKSRHLTLLFLRPLQLIDKIIQNPHHLVPFRFFHDNILNAGRALKPFKYQARCLRISRTATASPFKAIRRSICRMATLIFSSAPAPASARRYQILNRPVQHPRVTQCAPPDHDTVAAGLVQHPPAHPPVYYTSPLPMTGMETASFTS